MTAAGSDLDQGLWLSVSALAKRKGVKKQTISEKVAALVEKGLIETKPGKGKSKLVNVAQYDTAIGAVGDAANEAGAATKAADTDAAPASAPVAPKFRDAQTREKEYAADLLYLKLERERGNLLPLDGVKAAAEDAAAVIVEIIDRLQTRAEDVTAAAAKDGEHTVRVVLKNIAREQREQIAAALRNMVTASVAIGNATVAIAETEQSELPIPAPEA